MLRTSLSVKSVTIPMIDFHSTLCKVTSSAFYLSAVIRY